MMTTVAAAIVVGTLMGPKQGASLDPCRLLTAAELTSALGSAPSGGKPVGPTIEKEIGGRSWACDQHVGEGVLSITVYEFATAAAAAQGWTAMLKESRDTPEAFQLAPASGPGDRAAWGGEDGGGMWVVLKGKYMLNVTLAVDTTDPLRLREPLKRLTTLALGRLVP